MLKQTSKSQSNSGRSEKYYNILLLYKYINLMLLNPFFCYTSNFWIESISLKDNKSFNAITPKELFSYVYKLIWQVTILQGINLRTRKEGKGTERKKKKKSRKKEGVKGEIEIRKKYTFSCFFF